MDNFMPSTHSGSLDSASQANGAQIMAVQKTFPLVIYVVIAFYACGNFTNSSIHC